MGFRGVSELSICAEVRVSCSIVTRSSDEPGCEVSGSLETKAEQADWQSLGLFE